MHWFLLDVARTAAVLGIPEAFHRRSTASGNLGVTSSSSRRRKAGNATAVRSWDEQHRFLLLLLARLSCPLFLLVHVLRFFSTAQRKRPKAGPGRWCSRGPRMGARWRERSLLFLTAALFCSSSLPSLVFSVQGPSSVAAPHGGVARGAERLPLRRVRGIDSRQARLARLLFPAAAIAAGAALWQNAPLSSVGGL